MVDLLHLRTAVQRLFSTRRGRRTRSKKRFRGGDSAQTVSLNIIVKYKCLDTRRLRHLPVYLGSPMDIACTVGTTASRAGAG